MCMIDDIDDGERYEVWNVRTIKKARKPHRCDECGRSIKPGESYRVYTGLLDGEWNSHPTCLHCQVACDWLTENCHGFLQSGVHEDISEHAREYRRFDLYRIEIGMLRKWKNGTMPVPKLPKPITVA